MLHVHVGVPKEYGILYSMFTDINATTLFTTDYRRLYMYAAFVFFIWTNYLCMDYADLIHDEWSTEGAVEVFYEEKLRVYYRPTDVHYVSQVYSRCSERYSIRVVGTITGAVH